MIESGSSMRRAAAAAVLATAAIVGVIAGAASASGSNVPEAAPSRAGEVTAPVTTPQYSVNAVGETYGSAMRATTPAAEPDLIKAQATNGKVGYVRASELDAASGADVDNPSDALAWNKHLDTSAKSRHADSVAVYLADGKTVIGVFEVINPASSAAEPVSK